MIWVVAVAHEPHAVDIVAKQQRDMVSNGVGPHLFGCLEQRLHGERGGSFGSDIGTDLLVSGPGGV